MKNKSNFKMPEVIDLGTLNQSTIYSLDTNIYRFRNVGGGSQLTDKAERYVCGYPIPDIQRRVVWDIDKQIKFIESAWKGLPLGTYTIHEIDLHHCGTPKRFSGWLIDGQQRLTSIQNYFDDVFPIFGAYWSELEDNYKNKFTGIKFSVYRAELWDINLIKELYEILSYGGVNHDVSQY